MSKYAAHELRIYLYWLDRYAWLTRLLSIAYLLWIGGRGQQC